MTKYLLIINLLYAFISSQCPHLELSTDCFGQTLNDFYCCEVNNLGNVDGKYCYKLSKNEYKGQTSITVQEEKHFINCGPGAIKVLSTEPESQRCGPEIPSSLSDCNQFSTADNTCCFYKENSNTGCAWAGTSYKGESLLNNKHITLSISCFDINIQVCYLSIVLSVILIIY